jgi:DNA (cytosine-5)-methyltransferase 1
MNELALFAGAGGGILGGQLLGWRTICAVEIDIYCRSVLLARQRDGLLEKFPIWDDVRTFNGQEWRGKIDVISGGFPCQDISTAGGSNRRGIEGERSGLWREMARIIREIQPRFAFVENSPALTFRGLHRVLGDLAALGFDAEWGVLGAHHVGGIHKRERIWILAYANEVPAGCKLHDGDGPEVGWEGNSRLTEFCCMQGGNERWSAPTDWPDEPGVCRVVNGLAYRMERLQALGNGQVPRVAATAFKVLKSHAS